MRRYAGVAVALLVLLAGCSTSVLPGVEGTPSAEGEPTVPSDPPEDRLGWEDGYWYNETLAVDESDGLNESEREAVVARSMARIEHLRGLEFERSVPVEVVSRETYREEFAAPDHERTDEFRRFDNAKFEALFLIGEDRDALAVQDENRGANVLGVYSGRNESIVVVGDGATLDERTLAHELVHALQDQHWGMDSFSRPTRERYNAVNGLVEGDASLVERRYLDRCEAEWDCFSPDDSGAGRDEGGDVHLGVYFLNYFPYSDGPGFVAHHRERGGWETVDGMYDAPPESTEQVISPGKYREDAPTNVSLADRTANGWERVRLPERDRPDHATLGQSALSSMFAYTFVDSYEPRSVVDREEFVNYDGRQPDQNDPFDYDLAYTDGWDGDRLHVYEKDGETAYVWKLVWDSPAEAEEFARGYRELLDHWGGERVRDGVWRIDRGPFADAYSVRVDGDTVVIVNAPAVEDLGDVRGR